jgi:hypothetical protein
MPEKSKHHVLFSGNHEYLLVDGDLRRAFVSRPLVNGARPSELWVARPAGEFALRSMRLQAGLPECSKR